MASLHPSELESAATDTVASSPRSEHFHHDPRVRFMCSFGGKILPRPHDNQLRYVGGDTRIVAVHRSITFSILLAKLSKLSGFVNVSVKYQLPNEDLDALISVTTDEDVENMMDEYDRFSQNQNPRSARLRLFLFGEDLRTSSISSLLDGSANREHWFFDAINSGARLERERSEASSIVSEVPDYLFGLDNSDDTQPLREPKFKTRPVLQETVSASDPGSPAPVISSPFCSTSSAVPVMPPIPDLPPVKTKPDNNNPMLQPKRDPEEGFSEKIEPPMAPPAGYQGNPMMHYFPDSHYPGPPVHHMPVYYVQGSVPPVQPVQMQPPSYVQQYQVPMGQVPVGYHHQAMGQVYGTGGVVRPMTTAMDPHEAGRMVPDARNQIQQVYYGVRSAGVGMVPGYRGPVASGPGVDDLQRNGSDPNYGRVSLS